MKYNNLKSNNWNIKNIIFLLIQIDKILDNIICMNQDAQISIEKTK